MKPKSKSQPKPAKELSPFMREVLAILFLAVGVFFTLCLLSYDPMDPSFATLARGREIGNWGGIIGSYLADLLFLLLGGGAYFIGFFFFLVAVLLFAGYRTRIRAHEALLYFIFVVFISVLFQLRAGSMDFGSTSIEAGGLLGGLLARTGLTYLGRPGTWLVVLFGSLVTFVWATRVSLKQLFYWGRALVVPLGRIMGQQAVIHYARARKFLSVWREERKKKKTVPAAIEVKINRQPLGGQPGSGRQSTPFTRPAGPGALQGLTAKPAGPVANQAGSITGGQAPAGSPPSGLPSGGLPPEPTTGEPRILDRVDKKRSRSTSPQLELHHMTDGYRLPPLSLLDSDSKQEVVVDEDSLKMQARMLEKKLLDFAVEGHVTEIHPGPVITMFEFAPAPGVKLSRIANLVDDLSLAMGGRPVRIVAPLPNKPAVGIEIPNNVRETVWLKDVIVDEKFQRSESRLAFALGKDIEGIPYITDLSKMPHLLVAGATGAGKSVSINSMIISLLYKATPEEVRVIMVDPKMLELSLYEGIPHLLLPVVTEPKKASLALRWAVREMERRYKLLSDINARNIINYNKKIEKGDYQSKRAALLTSSPESVAAALSEEDEIRHEGKLPYIVILIDELADLMMVSSREVEESITRLAQMARAAGIHLILATQRPSVDVLTGVIKANFPARISFKVSSKHDSRTILDTVGSEHLLGAGDMLFIPPGASQMIRVHGAYVTESEIGRIVDFLKKQAKPIYDESILKPIEVESDDEGGEDGMESDALYDQAVAIVAETRQASISMIQRKLRVGYNRAARMIEKMEVDGIVSPPSGAGHRQVLVSSFEAPSG